MSLDITEQVSFDDLLKRKEIFTHLPYASTTYGNNDIIRIPVQYQDAITSPAESFLHITGNFVKRADGNVTTSKLSVNALAYLFSEIRYELGGVEIAQSRNVGITSTIKGYLSHTPSELNALENTGWQHISLNPTTGAFDVCLPLRMLLGYFEDQTRVIINLKQELILVRSSSDDNAYIADGKDAEDSKFLIKKISWNLPQLTVSDEQRLKLLNIVASGQPLPLSFRNWELIEHPLLPATKRHLWQVKTSQSIETPRFVVIAFQTNRIGNKARDASMFDHCKLRNITVFLNSAYYPHTPINSDFDMNEFSQLYNAYAKFGVTYYDRDYAMPLLTPKEFKDKAPLFVVDVSSQDGSFPNGSVDIRVEVSVSDNFPPNTTAYCLLLHDRLVEYTPLTSIVNKLI